MDWQLGLLLLLGGLLIMMATGMPVAFSFLLVNLVGALLFWGGGKGIAQLVLSMRDSVTIFTLIPLPLFILMGEIMFNSGIAQRMLDALDKLLGRLPGRLSLLAVGGGTVFASLTGVTMGNVAMLGTVLLPEMERRGYKQPMSLGPILGSGALAVLIPPSSLAILIGAIGKVPIGNILLGIIIPGLLLAVLYAFYIIVRCHLQPSLAPIYSVETTPLLIKFIGFARYVLPLGFIIFLVVGIILLGVATPSEAAACGAFGCFILCVFYRKLNWEMLKKSLASTTSITVMIFIILTGALAFGQNIAMIGANQGISNFVLGLKISPILTIALMLVIVVIMGTFMEITSIVMITLPLYMPIINALGFDQVWFAVVMLVAVTTGSISPPFGLDLFVMKAVAPANITMGDIYKAATPFFLIELTCIGLLVAFPILVLWLPNLL